jgi:hypothetical protein
LIESLDEHDRISGTCENGNDDSENFWGNLPPWIKVHPFDVSEILYNFSQANSIHVLSDSEIFQGMDNESQNFE